MECIIATAKYLPALQVQQGDGYHAVAMYCRSAFDSKAISASRYLTTSPIETIPASLPLSITGTCRNLPLAIPLHQLINRIALFAGRNLACHHRLILIISPGVPATALILVKSEGICALWWCSHVGSGLDQCMH
jgi:hypothetical protein